MDIKELQNKIVEFANKRTQDKGFKLTTELSYIHLTEEVGEIARQLCNKEMRPELFDKDNLKEEIFDVILEALILAHSCDIEINEIEGRVENLFKRHGYT